MYWKWPARHYSANVSVPVGRTWLDGVHVSLHVVGASNVHSSSFSQWNKFSSIQCQDSESGTVHPTIHARLQLHLIPWSLRLTTHSFCFAEIPTSDNRWMATIRMITIVELTSRSIHIPPFSLFALFWARELAKSMPNGNAAQSPLLIMVTRCAFLRSPDQLPHVPIVVLGRMKSIN